MHIVHLNRLGIQNTWRRAFKYKNEHGNVDFLWQHTCPLPDLSGPRDFKNSASWHAPCCLQQSLFPLPKAPTLSKMTLWICPNALAEIDLTIDLLAAQVHWLQVDPELVMHCLRWAIAHQNQESYKDAWIGGAGGGGRFLWTWNSWGFPDPSSPTRRTGLSGVSYPHPEPLSRTGFSTGCMGFGRIPNHFC